MKPGDDPAREAMAMLARQADRVSVLVLKSDYPDVDVICAVENLRVRAYNLFPDSADLFEMIYVSRFRRLWNQWRSAGEPPF